MWPGFWFCVVAVKGPLEIMAANYGDYDTSLVINCTQGVPLSRPTDLGCLFNERCFDLQFWTTYLTMNNVDKMTLSKNVNWDLCSRWENTTQKGPLAALEKQLSFLKWWGPSGLAKNYCWPVFIVACGGLDMVAPGHYCERQRWQKGCESCHRCHVGEKTKRSQAVLAQGGPQ